MNKENNVKIYKLLCKKNLAFFIKESFSIINPGVEFLDNWHIGLIAEYLESVTNGSIKRLIINVPPRSLKSICISVCWPAWLLGGMSSRRIICASYSQKLSNKLSLDCRHLMLSSFFKGIFPGSVIDKSQNQKSKFLTSERGFRLAASVGGTMTGEGGNFLIVDDPHNAVDVNSDKKRKNVLNWFSQSFVSRLDNKKKGVIVVVMQRLHVNDLSGFLLENNKSKNWTILNIPAIASESIEYKLNNFRYHFTKGSFLHADREGKEEINRIREELGNYAFSAQYLQEPVSISSGMIKKSWIMRYRATSFSEFSHIMHSWDTAIKSGDQHSYSVCTVWGEKEGGYFLLDIFRDRCEYPDLKKEIIYMTRKWNPDLILIEDKASGQSLLQDLKRESSVMPLVSVKVNQDKMTRFARVSVMFENRKIFIPESGNWVDEYEKELLSFPNSKNDDQVDSTSQYLYHVLNQANSGPSIRSL